MSFGSFIRFCNYHFNFSITKGSSLIPHSSQFLPPSHHLGQPLSDFYHHMLICLNLTSYKGNHSECILLCFLLLFNITPLRCMHVAIYVSNSFVVHAGCWSIVMNKTQYIFIPCCQTFGFLKIFAYCESIFTLSWVKWVYLIGLE